MHLPRSFRLLFAAVVAVPLMGHAAQEAGLSQAAMDAGQSYVRALESAASAYSQHAFPQALEKLDIADQIHPDIPDTWNMRGAVYAELQKYDKAQDAFERAAKLNPGDFWPRYNLAQLLLTEKKYKQASAAFQKLTVYQGHDELVQFKIILSSLLAGDPATAKPIVDSMKFPCSTPAYYYAQAAWDYANKNEKEGNSWIRTSEKVFGHESNIAFYDSLASVGWVQPRNPDGSMPDKTELTAVPAPAPGGGAALTVQPLSSP